MAVEQIHESGSKSNRDGASLLVSEQI